MTLHPDVPGTWFQLAIELTEMGAASVGDCGLHTLADRPGLAEIGFTLAREHQGKGYATEAVNGVLDYVFGTLEKHREIAVADARNAPAARVLDRVGMRREGISSRTSGSRANGATVTSTPCRGGNGGSGGPPGEPDPTARA